MKMTPESYLIMAAVAGGLYLAWSAKSAVKQAAAAANPMNNNNAVQQGLNAITGHDGKNSTWSTGLLDWLTPSYDPNGYKKGIPAPVKPAASRVTK